jgi:hypothetical protein
MTQTSNGRAQRKSLATEIDRLDNILDGLDEALAGAVEMAVRDVTARVVREAVEAAVREVLSSPELLRAAVARHAPVATPAPQQPRRTLSEWLKEKLAGLYHRAKRSLGGAWHWCLAKVRKGCCWLRDGCKFALSLATVAACAAWKFRRATVTAVSAGALVGGGAYLAGPIIASSLCGLGGALMTAAGMVLWPLWKLMRGNGG